MTDELVKHPVIPTWPTPAAEALMKEADRLRRVAEQMKYNLDIYKPFQDTLDCILEEHKKWRESVMNPTKLHEEEYAVNRIVPYRPLGGPVAKPSTFWKLFAIFEFSVIVIYLFVKLLKG